MTRPFWLRAAKRMLTGRARSPITNPTRRGTLRCEPLEDRSVPAVLSNFLTTEHVDLNIGYSGGAWTLQPRDDDHGGVSYSPDDALLYVGAPAATGRPGGAAFEFIGTTAGSTFYKLPQSQNPNLLYLGVAGYGTAAADFDTYNPSAESKGRVSGTGKWVKMSLVDVKHYTPAGAPGAGKFSVWQSDDNGPVPFMSNYNDGVANPNGNGLDTTDGITADDALWIVAGGHIHYNWGFTEKGRYEVTVKLSGRTPDGNDATAGAPFTSGNITLYFSVGSVGQLEFSSAAASVGEGDGSATVTVRRVGGSDGRITVNYATSDGTATAGSDYTAASGTLTFNDGETQKTFAVPITDDTVSESNETVNLTLSSPGPASIANYVSNPNGDNSSLLGAQRTAVLTIVDNDAPNTPPTISGVSNQTTPEDTAKTVSFTVGDAQTPAGSLTMSASSSNTTLVPVANITFGGSGANRTATITPAADRNGTVTITLTVTDAGGLPASTSFVLTVTPVNDAPVASPRSVSTDEDTAKSITLAATDVDGDPLTYSIVTGPAHGTLSGSGATRTYTPAANYNGADSFTFKANDGTADSNVATVSITVGPTNDPPGATPQSVTTAEDTAKSITLAGIDPDGDALTYVVVTGPAHGTLTGTGVNLTYTPAANYNGADSFTFKANDGTVDSAPATVSITVTPVDDAPVAAPDAYAVSPGNAVRGNVLFNDSDPEGDAFTATTVVTAPTAGTLALNPDGTFTYTPGAGFAGSDSFTYTATAGGLTSAPATVTITAAGFQPIQATLATGHVDIGVNYEDGAWDLHVHNHETDAEYEPDAAVYYVAPAALASRPAGSQFDFIGVAAGQPYYRLTQTQNPELLYLGFGLEELEDGLFENDAVDVRLLAVNGPGQFSVWESTDAGPSVLFATSDGVTAADARTFHAGADAHYNFGFTAAGRYEVTIQASGTLVGASAPTSATATYYFSVDSLGRFQFDTPTATVAEGGDATLTVRRVGGSDGVATVAVGPTGGTAISGVDYAPFAGTLTFGDGETVKTVVVSALTDAEAEGNETVTVGLTAPADSPTQLGSPAEAVVTITNVAPVVTPPSPGGPVSGTRLAQFIVLGSGDGRVQVLNATTRTLVREFTPFAGYGGAVTVAAGDVNGDGVTDVIAAAGNSHVKVFDGKTGAELLSVVAFPGYAGSVSVAAGDVDGDGKADVVIGTAVGNSHVKVFSGATGAELRSFLAFPGYLGGVRVAAADVVGDGKADVIVVANAGGNGHVKAFDGATNAAAVSFLGYPGYAGELGLAAGDVDGDGRAEIVTVAQNPTGGTHVRAFSASSGTFVRSYFAPQTTTGFGGSGPAAGESARVAVGDVTGDGVADVLLATPPQAGQSKLLLLNGATQAVVDSRPAFDDVLGLGVFVGLN